MGDASTKAGEGMDAHRESGKLVREERMRNAAVAGAEDFGGVKVRPGPVDKAGAISGLGGARAALRCRVPVLTHQTRPSALLQRRASRGTR
jgi:hypothetical protein